MGFNEEKFKDFMNSRQDFNSYVGTKVIEVHDGMAKMKVDLRPEVLNRWGIPHGGLIFTLADTAAGIAAMSVGERCTVTSNASVSFMRPGAPEGTLRAEAHVLKHGRTLAFVNVEVFDGRDSLIVAAQFTMAYTDRPLPEME